MVTIKWVDAAGKGVTPQATFYNRKKNTLNSLTELPDLTRGIRLGRT